MSCDWCNYDLKLVYPNFNGYAVLNEVGEATGDYCCSINCCISRITNLGYQVDTRLDQLYIYYNITSNVKMAKEKKFLAKFGLVNFPETPKFQLPKTFANSPS